MGPPSDFAFCPRFALTARMGVERPERELGGGGPLWELLCLSRDAAWTNNDNLGSSPVGRRSLQDRLAPSTTVRRAGRGGRSRHSSCRVAAKSGVLAAAKSARLPASRYWRQAASTPPWGPQHAAVLRDPLLVLLHRSGAQGDQRGSGPRRVRHAGAQPARRARWRESRVVAGRSSA